ncbi:glycosyltransferase [Mesorhizobium sp. B2-3-4]|uniref:glycosyltransferase n=1 Tax=Mesorhizobium sp. B2-3-4 TaxID=2589959 RepID=UPI001FEF5EE1|nr:glycosyltransferase [Mesorhizobium sp. B2-3-4]
MRPDVGMRAHTGQRVLIVCHEPAFPPTSGADLRNYSNAVAAAALGPVCLASVLPKATAMTAPDPRIRIEALSIEDEPRTASIGWWRIRAEHRISRTAVTRLEALVREFRPDTVVVESIGLFKLLRPLRPLAKQLILDMHNVESDLSAQMRREPTASRFSIVASAPGIRRLERKALALADRVWVCSNEDCSRLVHLAGRQMPIDVVPNGIPGVEIIPETLPVEPAKDRGFPAILFIGHLGYPPNVDAAERLARVILPRIRRALPGAKLVLAGRSPKPDVRALAGLPDVELVENPESVAPLLSGAHLTIIPLKAGGGTRIKILEAMAWGVPVIATPLAAEGLGLVENDQVLLSASDEGLADMAIELSLDAERRSRQRVRAHQAVWARFGQQAIRDAVRAGLALDSDGIDEKPSPLTP